VVPRKRDPRQVGIFDAPVPAFIRPQLAKLVAEAPEGERWAHELKFDGYRMHARIDRGRVQLITARSGLDWTSKYPATAEALKTLPLARVYLDGQLGDYVSCKLARRDMLCTVANLSEPARGALGCESSGENGPSISPPPLAIGCGKFSSSS
jgi:hypothetical protein